jgi:glycerol transport system ATP-binding protein
MAKIIMDNIAHRYPVLGNNHAEYALQPLSMEWEDGGAYALLGPSGCGKTTLLNIISGLVTPSTGRILFDDQDVTGLAPQQRNIAQVFQFPVVYDTMTVAENLEFPLKNRGMPAAKRKQRVAQVLEMLELTALADEKARNLNAANKQKISLGRGLVRTDANAVLFDEPLTVIDPALKWQLRAQLKKVHLQVGHTMIYVTHDQTEALTFAEKVIVMLEGRVLQVGTPRQLFDEPAHTFVGRFIGSPGMNVLACVVTGDTANLEGNRVNLGCDHGIVKESLELGIRPENVRLFEQENCPDGLVVHILKIDDIGRQKIVHLKLGGQELHAILKEETPIPQSPVALFDPEHIHLYRDSRLLSPRSAT